jgi:hypothetical protein
VGLKAGVVVCIFAKNHTNQRSFEFFGRTSTPPKSINRCKSLICSGFFIFDSDFRVRPQVSIARACQCCRVIEKAAQLAPSGLTVDGLRSP